VKSFSIYLKIERGSNAEITKFLFLHCN